MKAKFTSADIVAMVGELKALVGMRVKQVYDVDSKTYLFKLVRQEEKAVLIFESGIRIHTTEYDWPKGMAPSGFSSKLRKHLKNKRLATISQLGVDRIVDLQFGINEAANHVIVELYDRGNVVLTDNNFIILNILRPRQAGSEDVRFAVREKYPIAGAIQEVPEPSQQDVIEWLTAAKETDTVKKIIVPKVFFGPAVLEHVLLSREISANTKLRKAVLTPDFFKSIHSSIVEGNAFLEKLKQPDLSTGIISLKVEPRVKAAEDGSMEIASYNEFHPFLFKQLEGSRVEHFATFGQAVDAFFSMQEQQKIDLRAHNLEKEAVKKLENVKLDHEKRLNALEGTQRTDLEKAMLIENNLELVEKALYAVRSFVASQYSWDEIGHMIKEAQHMGDPVACTIKALHLDRNQFGMLLSNSFENDLSPSVVDIDIDLSAYANARRYFDMKKHAARKQQKTIESSAKALKSAQKKTKEILKQVELTTNIARTRKSYWFEKFFWFISSENYLVIGGRDAQQNEVIVKKYMTKGDIYVHADLHGASSVVIKNPSGGEIPPKTLNEAGTMAICYSAAWEAKVVTSAWWVHHHQVTKTAPSGEYLTAGSFMIRGKKNYLPPLYLIMGFGFMFRLDEESVPAHQNDRKVWTADETTAVEDNAIEPEGVDEQNEIDVSTSEDEAGESAFPDTQINLINPIGNLRQNSLEPAADEEIIVYSQATKSKTTTVQVDRKKVKGQKKGAPPPAAKASEGEQKQPKKLSKAKMRKIKQRYGDQDDEERELRMKILASAGKQSQNTETEEGYDCRSGGQKEACDDEDSEQKTTDRTLPESTKTEARTEEQQDGVEDEDDADEDLPSTDDLTAILNSLTGTPLPEDVLLYGVPVCAPYSIMTNYKFKVKVTPGTAKRGKAAKIALNMFQHDKTASQREKDLLRVTKDQDIARNMPGKVKLSAPNLQKLRK
ncbi:nuclear export mediator factor NEMF [Galendromus occidentalis]|uniref:Nuclear export mediator factor NEMF n=1 Tax=Galendromus occidentalis TaxID=34638 RepID=A0AAJ7WHN2_9ACAR|nr:nuclear export mediator factor NEMF [Galendromus occidentalis]